MMRKMMLVGLIAGMAIVIASDSLAATPETPPAAPKSGISIDLGQRDFRSYCAPCHGVGGAGDGTVAEFLTISAPDLTWLKKLNAGIFPREKIREVIDGRIEVKVHGARDMPVWGDWFNQEAVSSDTDAATREIIVRERIESLINYIETLQAN
jgi:mono/diheme cytochrome c family protein